MALSRRTADTDMITIRQVWAYNSNDSVIPALRCLTSDGAGGTFWATPSSLGGIPAFNSVVANGVPIVADAPSNALVLSTFGGLALLANSNTKRIDLAATCFSRFEISSGNTLVAYSNQTITPTVRFVASGSLNISGDPLTNTLYFQTTPTAISTGIFGYSQVAVTSNAAAPGDVAYLTATSPSTALGIVGYGDILLSTNVTSNTLVISISSFDSATYLGMSSLLANTYGSTLSTVSTLFVDKIQFSTGLSNLSTSVGIDSMQKYQFITNNYTTNALFQYVSTGTGQNVSNLFTQTFGLNGGLLSSVNVFSSLGLTPFGSGQGVQNTNASTFTFSSATFSLASLQTSIEKAQHTVIDYAPSFVLEGNTLSTQLTAMSTFLVAGTTQLLSTLYVRPLWTPSNADVVLYTDSLKIELDPTQLASAVTSTFQFYHVMTNYSSATTAVTDYTFPRNSLSVRITGTNFAGVY